MKKGTLILLVLLCSSATHIYGQVFTTSQGILILFEETIDVKASYTITSIPFRNETFSWPSSSQEFIRRYRQAQLTFGEPLSLTDEQLQLVYDDVKDASGGARAYQTHPTLLLALGCAAYFPDQKQVSEVMVDKKTDDKKTVQITLHAVDHRISDPESIRTMQQDRDETDILLVFRFPAKHWIDSAHVTKQVVGSSASKVIKPILLVSTLGDSTTLQLWDTSGVIGEFIYTLAPYDKLGVRHAALPGVHAHNYTKQSSPRFTDFNVDMNETDKSIKLTWETTYQPRVRGYAIYRTVGQNGTFRHVADVPSSEKTYVDHVRGSHTEYYYYVQVMDQFGPGEKSVIKFVVPKTKEKPQPPETLFARPVKGGVELAWPTHDPFYHVMGYYVYRQNKERTAWEQVSIFLPREVDEMIWTDTSSALQAEIEYVYALRAVSTSNQESEHSTLAYARPQLERNVPTPSVPGYRYLETGQLMLYWNDMRAADRYISAYHIYETDAAGNVGKEVAGSPVDASNVTWHAPAGYTPGKGYVIQAADSWGNRSALSNDVTITRTELAHAPGAIIIKATAKGHRISWGTLNDPMIKAVQVYETPFEGKPSMIKSLAMPASGYDIPKPKTPVTRSYHITFKYSDGKESAASEMVVVQ